MANKTTSQESDLNFLKDQGQWTWL